MTRSYGPNFRIVLIISRSSLEAAHAPCSIPSRKFRNEPNPAVLTPERLSLPTKSSRPTLLPQSSARAGSSAPKSPGKSHSPLVDQQLASPRDEYHEQLRNKAVQGELGLSWPLLKLICSALRTPLLPLEPSSQSLSSSRVQTAPRPRALGRDVAARHCRLGEARVPGPAL